MRAIGMLVRICLLLVLAAHILAGHSCVTQVIAQGLSSPLAFVPDPTSTTRFFIVEQGGLIRVLDSAQVLPTPFLDLRPPSFLAGGEQGLLGMAFAPDAATSGRFFVNFTSRSGDIVVARFQRIAANAPRRPTAASRFDLIWPSGQPFIAHPDEHEP